MSGDFHFPYKSLALIQKGAKRGCSQTLLVLKEVGLLFFFLSLATENALQFGYILAEMEEYNNTIHCHQLFYTKLSLKFFYSRTQQPLEKDNPPHLFQLFSFSFQIVVEYIFQGVLFGFELKETGNRRKPRKRVKSVMMS